MRLVVLGSGTCMPTATRRASGHFVEAGPARLRLDCGPGTLQAMAAFGLPWEEVTHQVVSHFHPDHVGELAFFLQALKHGRQRPRTAPLSLVGPVGLRALVRALEATFGTTLLEQAFPVDVVEVGPGDALPLGGGARLALEKSLHTDESLAVRIDDDAGQALGYTGDTAPCAALPGFFRGVDLLLGECSFVEGTRGTKHLDAAGLAALARDAGARRVVATHFYFDPDREGLAARLASGFDGAVTVAEDGIALDL
jgi:ribonuclease BN (tRNA processing enzyme)